MSNKKSSNMRQLTIEDIIDDTEEEEKDEEKVSGNNNGQVKFENKVLNMYLKGFTNKEIMERNNISSGKLYSILYKWGQGDQIIQTNTKNNESLLGMTTKSKNQLIKDYKEGMVLEDIYEKYGINKNACYKILDMNNVERRGNVSKISQEEDNEIDSLTRELIDEAADDIIEKNGKPEKSTKIEVELGEGKLIIEAEGITFTKSDLAVYETYNHDTKNDEPEKFDVERYLDPYLSVKEVTSLLDFKEQRIADLANDWLVSYKDNQNLLYIGLTGNPEDNIKVIATTIARFNKIDNQLHSYIR